MLPLKVAARTRSAGAQASHGGKRADLLGFLERRWDEEVPGVDPGAHCGELRSGTQVAAQPAPPGSYRSCPICSDRAQQGSGRQRRLRVEQEAHVRRVRRAEDDSGPVLLEALREVRTPHARRHQQAALTHQLR